jgi:holo-[acyl-carrier protein] synthase
MVIGTGIDIIEVERIKKVFAERSEKFLKKIYTQNELDYSFQFKEAYPHLAARFSAKEALYKSIGFGVIHFADIEVLNEPSGKPYVVLHGETKERWEALGSPKILISLSHTNTMASAVVVLETGK